MIVSNFELLIKRIATVPSSTPANISAVFRRVVQGYFLNITNLNERRAANLFLRITITNSSGNRIIRSTNTQCFFDNGNVNNLQLGIKDLVPTGGTLRYITDRFQLGSKETGLITVLPNVIPFISVDNPDLEIRGYIELLQSRFNGRFFTLGSVPASTVLITPETRGTFLDNDYPSLSTSNELDFDQIAYGISTASGKSENQVEALPRIIFNQTGNLTITQFKKDNPQIGSDDASDILAMIKEMNKMKK